MEISQLDINYHDKQEYNEIINLIYIKQQNVDLIKKLKIIDELYNNTIIKIINKTNKKEQELKKLNDIFDENNKHFKYIMRNLNS
jgi:hypothetical protein